MRTSILSAAQCRIMNNLTSGSPYVETHSGLAVALIPPDRAIREQYPNLPLYIASKPKEMTGG